MIDWIVDFYTSFNEKLGEMGAGGIERGTSNTLAPQIPVPLGRSESRVLCTPRASRRFRVSCWSLVIASCNCDRVQTCPAHDITNIVLLCCLEGARDHFFPRPRSNTIVHICILCMCSMCVFYEGILCMCSIYALYVCILCMYSMYVFFVCVVSLVTRYGRVLAS